METSEKIYKGQIIEFIYDAALHHKFTNLKWELQKRKAHLLGSPIVGKMLVNYWGKPSHAGIQRVSAALQAVGLQNRVSVDRVMATNYYELRHGRRALRPYEIEAEKYRKGKSNKGHHYGQIKNASKKAKR